MEISSLADCSASIQTQPGSAEVQVSAQLLKKLLSSVDQLQRTVELLETKNASLEASVARLEQDNAVRLSDWGSAKVEREFHGFSRLPIEIRTMIWTYAFRSPQVHMIKDHDFGKSKLNVIMDCCKEARVVGCRMSLDYYIMRRGGRHQYMDIEKDTIWFRDKTISYDFPHFFCGTCHEPVFEGEGLNTGCQHRVRLRRLAMSVDVWADPKRGPVSLDGAEDPYKSTGSTWLVRLFNARELFIVVGDEPETDMNTWKFDVPTREPWQVVPKVFISMIRSRGDMCRSYFHWDEAIDLLKDKLHHLKMTMLKYTLNRSIEEGMTDEEIENDDDPHGHRGYSLWELPTVKYVQVITDVRS